MASGPQPRDRQRATTPAAGVMAQLGVPGIAQETEIGRGGFGTVYRGVEEDLGREVAVKVLPAGLGQRDRDRFDRERRAMGSLSGHPNIVTVHRTGFTPAGQPYIVMEYLERGSMEDRLRRDGPVPWEEAARIGIALAGAVHSAHLAGILHRDIKPGNVLISSRGEPKLADFGIARMEGAPETSSSVITASVAHAGPEIIDGRRPSAASDLYSLASTIYNLIAGRPAFSDPADQSIVPLLARIARDPLPPLDGFSAGGVSVGAVPDALWSTLARAMAKDPDERHPTVEAFGQELAAILDSGGVAPASPSTGGAEAPVDTMVVAPPPPISDAALSPEPSEPSEPSESGRPTGSGAAHSSVAQPAVTGPPPQAGLEDGGGRARSLAPWLAGAALMLVLVGVAIVVAVVALRPDAAAATLPADTGEDYPAYTSTFDASGAIQVSLPEAWSDTDLGGSALLATIAAAADRGAALDSTTEPGALITVSPEPLADADASLDRLVDPEGCRDRGRGDYDDGTNTGRFHHLSDCGEAGAQVWVVVAAPPEGGITIVVSVQAVDPRDETAARRILDSFVVEPRAVPGS